MARADPPIAAGSPNGLSAALPHGLHSLGELARAEETLDPHDWDAMRALAHRMVDDMMSHLETLRSRGPWQPIPDAVKARLRADVPLDPSPPESVYDDFRECVLPYPYGNFHPRFWGWVNGTGSPLAMMADMLASGLNPNCAGGEHAATYVEMQVLDWLRVMMGMPAGSDGLLVSGGSMANLLGLTAARNRMAAGDVRQAGVWGLPARMTLYCSSETHHSVRKAAELLGLGAGAVRTVPVDDAYRVRIADLRSAIQIDRRAGDAPFCIVGNAGTVNTGATDDLDALAELCAEEGLWFHVDGAFGAFARLSPALGASVSGVARADSLAFDLHKWMYLPMDVGCVLFRDGAVPAESFAVGTSYLAASDRGLLPKMGHFSDRGIELSRSFRALKAWMSLKAHGTRTLGRLVEQNVAQAAYLARRVEAEPELELLAPAPLNVVCFRYRAPDLDDATLDDLNVEVLARLHEQGIAVPSATRLRGRFALRVAITNHRSRREDFDALVDAVLRLGRALVPRP